MCKNVHVARPSCSESTGQPAGGSSGREVGVAVSSFVDEEGDPARITPVKPGKECASTGVFAFWLVVTAAGFQLRNAVQTLHGFPSGPITIPGGILSSGLDPSGDEDSPAAIEICSGRG